METIKKIYRVRRDMQTESEVISTEPNGITEIPVEKMMCKILHNIIMKEADVKTHENAE